MKISPLCELAKLQRDLQQSVASLLTAIEFSFEVDNLHHYVGIADRCMRLERDLGVLTKELLGSIPTQGVA